VELTYPNGEELTGRLFADAPARGGCAAKVQEGMPESSSSTADAGMRASRWPAP